MVRVGAYKTIYNDRTIIIHEPHPMFLGGFVKHVGKSVSVDYWESKCNHYSHPSMPTKYRMKWEQRKGKAVHTESDFNRPLHKWDDIISDSSKWVVIE